MPPFSPAWNGLLPNSRNEFCPEKPCQPSATTHGGSTRPADRGVPVQVVMPVVALIVQLLGAAFAPVRPPGQSADAQYTAPGTCSVVGTETVSKVFARLAAMAELPQRAG